MSWTRNPGRVAGLWYLLLVFAGPLRLMYSPNKLFVEGNAVATAVLPDWNVAGWLPSADTA